MASPSAPDSQSATEGSNPNQAQGRQAGDAPPRTVRSEMTIPVSEPQKKLLSNNEVGEEFYRKLQEDDIEIDSRSLHTDKIVVIQGDPMKAMECLASVICTETIDFTTFTAAQRSRTESSLKDLHERFPTQFSAQISQGDKAEIAFLSSIHSEVQPELDDLIYAKKLVPLSSYWYNFFQHRLPKFAANINSKLSRPVELSVSFNPNDDPLLQLKCEHARLPQVTSVLEENMTLLCYRQLKVETSRADYLQSSAGKEMVQSIERDHCCTMQVETRYEKVLLEAWSPQGHQVRVCEGNMAATQCPVIGIPVWEGEGQQSSYKCILQRGSIYVDLTRVGSPPKALTKAFRCQDLVVGQTVVIMFIPPCSHDHFQELVSAAVKEALQVANKKSNRNGLALPLKFRGDFSLDAMRHVLTAVCDWCHGNPLAPAVHFYLQRGETLPADMDSFFQDKGWTTEATTDSVDTIFDQRVEVLIGDILNAKGDAVVNSTDPELKHTFGQVSRVFLGHLGGRLTEQCRQRYPKGIDENIVAVTEAFDLQCKHIFHVVMPQEKWHVHSAAKLLQALRTCVEACLHHATAMGLSSLVFPALGTGTLQYPPDQEARTVLGTTRHFFQRTPHTSLTKVTFITYRDNPEVAKVFKAEEAVHRYGLRHSADSQKVERRFQVSKVLVQVIQGDAMTRRCTAQLLICASPPATGTLQNYRAQMGPGCTAATVDKNKVKNEVRDRLKSTTVHSVQLNMQTFDADHVDDIVEGIKKASAQTVLIVIIVVPSIDVFHRLCSKFESTRAYVSVAKSSTAGSQDQAHGHVGLCGPVNKTKEAVTKVLVMEVPDRYIQAEKCSLHASFLEGERASSALDSTLQASPAPSSAYSGLSLAMAVAAPPSEQAQEVIFSVTKEQLRGMDMFAVVKEIKSQMKVSISMNDEQVTFRTRQIHLAQLAAHVQSTLARQRTAAQHTAPAAGHSPAQGAAVPASSPTAVGTSAYLHSAGSITIPSLLRVQQRQSRSSKEADKMASDGGDEAGGGHDARSGSSPHAPGGGDAGSRHTPMASGGEDRAEDAGSQDESALLAAAREEAWAFLQHHYPGTTRSLDAKSLRQEEVRLTPQEVAKLGTSVDCLPAEAYVKVLPNLKKAIIFAFDYTGIDRAQHLVKMKCGKITVHPLRRKEKADQRPAVQSNTRYTQSSVKAAAERIEMKAMFFSRANPGQAPGRAAATAQFTTGKGLQVSVDTGDITGAQVDGVVNAAHEELTHQGGVAASIAIAAGPMLRDESNEYIARNGPLKVRDVVVTTAGSMPCQHVLHALGPRWADYTDKTLCQQHLIDTVYCCLMKAHSLSLTSLAVCSVSSGIFGVPKDVCADSYLKAVRDFDDKHGDVTRLRSVHFVDIDSHMVDVMQAAFADHWG